MQVVHAVAEVVLLGEFAVVFGGDGAGRHIQVGDAGAVGFHVFEAGVAGLAFEFEGALEVDFCAQVVGFEVGESVGVGGC